MEPPTAPQTESSSMHEECKQRRRDAKAGLRPGRRRPPCRLSQSRSVLWGCVGSSGLSKEITNLETGHAFHFLLPLSARLLFIPLPVKLSQAVKHEELTKAFFLKTRRWPRSALQLFKVAEQRWNLGWLVTRRLLVRSPAPPSRVSRCPLSETPSP